MPFSGGVFSVVNTFVPGTTILSAAVNANFSDIATGLSDCLTRDNQAGMTAPLRLTDGTAAAPALTFSSETDLGIRRNSSGVIGIGNNTTGDVIAFVLNGPSDGALIRGNIGGNDQVFQPIGMIVDFAGSTAPNGWLLCYGQSLLRSGAGSYPELFAAIGTTYGAADGSHFNVPDCRDRVSAGLGNMGGTDAGRITVAGGNFDGTVLGMTQDTQSLNIAQNQLPNASPSGSVTPTLGGTQSLSLHGSHAFTSTAIASHLPQASSAWAAANSATTGSPGFPQTAGSVSDLANGTVSTTVDLTNAAYSVDGVTFSNGTVSAVNGSAFSINGGVSQHLTPVLQPTIIFNKIIFAGR